MYAVAVGLSLVLVVRADETSAYKIRTPGNYPEGSIQHWRTSHCHDRYEWCDDLDIHSSPSLWEKNFWWQIKKMTVSISVLMIGQY